MALGQPTARSIHTMEPRRSSEQPRHASRRSAALDGDRFTLRVKLLRGSGLPAADRNGASDPYVVLRAAERKWRSSTCPKTLEHVWNEECQLDWVSMPQLRWLRLEVFDQDLVGSDPLGDALVWRRGGKGRGERMSLFSARRLH